MGGASNKSDDSGGGSSYSDQLKKIQKPNPVVKFIQGGGIPGAIIRTVKKSFEKSKTKKEANVEMGLGTDKISNYTTPTDNDRNDNNNSILSTNTEATKQVASSGVVTNNAVAPTTAEVSQATATNAVEPSASYSSNATLLANNKKGRKSTILQKAKGLGDSNLNTTKRTLGA